jgi:hypothetical protein
MCPTEDDEKIGSSDGMRIRIEFTCRRVRIAVPAGTRKPPINSAANSPISAPEAPTETKFCGPTASDISDPPSAPMTKKAKNHSRPIRRSRSQPPSSSATLLPAICAKFACRSGAVKSRYHSPPDRTAVR